MVKRMLIDATHPEETRVVVINGNRLEEFDYETATKEQIKSNIYLARITRVEPSLQAAFVEYGGNRQGFLAFSEIHPDYYRISDEERALLLEEERKASSRNPDFMDDDFTSDDTAQAEVSESRIVPNTQAVSLDPQQPAETSTPNTETAPTSSDATEPVEAGLSDTSDATDKRPQKRQGRGGRRTSRFLGGDDQKRSRRRRFPRKPKTLDLSDNSGEGQDTPAPSVTKKPDSIAEDTGNDTPSVSITPDEIQDAFSTKNRDTVTQDASLPDNVDLNASPDLSGEKERNTSDLPMPESAVEAVEQALFPITSPSPTRIPDLDQQKLVIDPQILPAPTVTTESVERQNFLNTTASGETEIKIMPTPTPTPTPHRSSPAIDLSVTTQTIHAAPTVTQIPAPESKVSQKETQDLAAEVQELTEDSNAVEPISTVQEDLQPYKPRPKRYKIQDVIKRQQILLIQVTKEERGNKGAALTTYLSLAGRYCVLMPNTARGGGVSRKITNPVDRKRLKTILEDLHIPEGMAVIVRTAGAERSRAEIKRDYEYLLRLWEDIRTKCLQASAPEIIYEEGDLIKRSIRDLYQRDIDEIQVEGEEGYKSAKNFMRMLMPSHARKIHNYRHAIPLYQRYKVETQLDEIHNPTVTLKSGGYIVINQTEALVAIDVNSGRATRERHIEDTALNTNLEASDEIALQLRLRDLAGLIVIDFIDMEDPKYQAQVERRLKEAMKDDRARVQFGRISSFGLMELSRQRLRPSVLENITHVCPACSGSGVIRSIESSALYVLRAVEEEAPGFKEQNLEIYCPADVALYILNQKRQTLLDLQERLQITLHFLTDASLYAPNYRIQAIQLTKQVRTHDQQESPAITADSENDGRQSRRPNKSRRDQGNSTPSNSVTTEGNGEERGPITQSELEASDEYTNKKRRGKRGGKRRSRRDETSESHSSQRSDYRGRQRHNASGNGSRHTGQSNKSPKGRSEKAPEAQQKLGWLQRTIRKLVE